MNTQPERSSLLQAESGQAAALVALLMFFVFMAFAALAIDGAMTYTVRRNLQNVADASALAACRVVSSGGATNAAILSATQSISNNLGSWSTFVGSNPPTSNAGAGPGLVKGIEVSGSEVHVAVQRQVPTVLSQFLGRQSSYMLAQARCSSTAGGGLLPIAVQRYDGGKNASMVDYLGRNGAPIYPNDSITLTLATAWNGRYGPFQPPVPCGNPGAPACVGNVNWTASDANPGPDLGILGQGANSNNSSSFNSFVMLDIRNLAGNQVETYNGVSGNANSNKKVSADWIYAHGYPGPYPEVGSEIAALNGVSNKDTAKAVQDAGYQVGDTVVAIVYDGYTYTTPDYDVVLQPTTSPSGIVSGRAVTYTVTINNASGSTWPSGVMNFYFRLNFSQGPASGTHVAWNGPELLPDASAAYSFALYNTPQTTGGSGTLRIWNTETITKVPEYLSGINLSVDSSLGLTKGDNGNFGIASALGSIPANDFTLSTDNGEIFLVQGGSAKANLYTYGMSAFSGCSAPVRADLYQNGVSLTGSGGWATYFTSNQNSTVQINSIATPAQGFALSATSGIPVGSYTLHFTVNSPCVGTTITPHSLDIPLHVKDPATASANMFVIIQGYAVFRITGFTANTVNGHAISPMYPSLSDANITFGLQSRLVPWDK